MASICRDALLLAAAGVLVAWLRVSLEAIAALHETWIGSALVLLAFGIAACCLLAWRSAER